MSAPHLHRSSPGCLPWPALAAALALLAAAPAGAADLVVWASSNKASVRALEEVAEAFNARQGAAALRVVVQQKSFDGFADRVAAAIPRGRGPDLFIYPQDRLGFWVEAGGVVEPLGARLEPALRERFVPAALQGVTYRGVVYGLPLDLKCVTLYHNRKLVPVPPRTSAELAAAARRLTRREAGAYGLVYRYADFYYHAALQNGFGGAVLDGALAPTLDLPANRSALELVVRWRADFLPDQSPSREEMAPLFNGGKAAMVIEGPWFRTELEPTLDYGLALLPQLSEARGEPMRPWLTVGALYLSARSAARDEAFAFASYASGAEAARLLVTHGGMLSANQQAQLDPAMLANPAVAAFYRQAALAVPMPNALEMSEMWAPAEAALGRAVRGEAAPAAALEQAQEQFVKGLARLRQRR